MVYESGFDMVPRLSGSEDQELWEEFIEHVQTVYKDESTFKIEAYYMVFEEGKQLILPFQGNNFLRFSSVTDHDSIVELHIDLVTDIASDYFGSRVRPWKSSLGEFGYYSEKEVNDSFRLYEQNNEIGGYKTIYTLRLIKAGEEITISYDEGGPSHTRKLKLSMSFGFDCACSLCSLPPSELQASDIRRVRIQQLDTNINNVFTTRGNPEANLKDCLSLLHTLQEEYGVCATPHIARLYYDAFLVCIAHGDTGRAAIFADRSYRARLICEGEDSSETSRMKSLVLDPKKHDSFGVFSMRWKTDEEKAPNGNGTVQFENWLFRHDS